MGWVMYDIEKLTGGGEPPINGFVLDWSSFHRLLPIFVPVGGWNLGACGVAVEACLGSIVYRAGEVDAVGNFIKTSDCGCYGVLVVRICATVTMNRFERSMRVVGCTYCTIAPRWHSADIQN
jgi:hypothetical protein